MRAKAYSDEFMRLVLLKICSHNEEISRDCPTRFRYTGSIGLLRRAIGSVGGSRKNAEPGFELKADYIEHPLKQERCSRRFVILCVIGFFVFKTVAEKYPNEADADFKTE